MPATMSDVAKQVGVSKAAVSMALNDKPGVSLELKETILQAAGELGYRLPDRHGLKRTVENKTITVVHCGGAEPNAHATPFGIYVAYLQGIEAFINENNLNLIVISEYRDGAEDYLNEHLLTGEKLAAGGLILMGMGVQQDSPIVHRIIQDKVPAVVLSRSWPHLPISTVSQDHYQQARIAFEYLVSLGHKRIAFVAREDDQRYDWFSWRLNVYREAIQALNGKIDESLIVLGIDGAQAAKNLMAHHPDITAIFAINDVSAASAMCGLAEIGVRIPQDISVIGLDDSTRHPDRHATPLTTVMYPHFKVGYLAAELLLKKLRSEDFYYGNIFVKSRLIERNSCTRSHV